MEAVICYGEGGSVNKGKLVVRLFFAFLPFYLFTYLPNDMYLGIFKFKSKSKSNSIQNALITPCNMQSMKKRLLL